MLVLDEAKKNAVGFLLKSIDKSWLPKPKDNDPLRFEAFLYLANLGDIKKSDWGDRIKLVWDSWVENAPRSESSKQWFWPAVKEYCIPYGDPDNADWEAGFNIENHLSMFRTQEVFSILGYSEYFIRTKNELRKILKSHSYIAPYEFIRLIWQIVRSLFLKDDLRSSIIATAHRIIDDISDNSDPYYHITIEEIFFLLNLNLEDVHFKLAKSSLINLVSIQKKNGSFFDDEIKTCLYLYSIHLSGIDPNGIISNRALAWIRNAQKENGSWQYKSRYRLSNNNDNRSEDIFVTVFVLEMLDLLFKDKPLPIWAEKVIPLKTFEKEGQSIGPSLTVPKGIMWGDVSITFISDEEVEIRAINPFGAKNFIALGFKDKRTGGPDKQWELLKTLANESGYITWKDKSAAPKLKPRVKILRRRLRELFSIEDDPFFPYRTSGGYRTKFTIEFRDIK